MLHVCGQVSTIKAHRFFNLLIYILTLQLYVRRLFSRPHSRQSKIRQLAVRMHQYCREAFKHDACAVRCVFATRVTRRTSVNKTLKKYQSPASRPRDCTVALEGIRSPSKRNRNDSCVRPLASQYALMILCTLVVGFTFITCAVRPFVAPYAYNRNFLHVFYLSARIAKDVSTLRKMLLFASFRSYFSVIECWGMCISSSTSETPLAGTLVSG